VGRCPQDNDGNRQLENNYRFLIKPEGLGLPING